ncbi:MAG TPA: hypothetical protein VKV20_08325 [Ktedonobacteraceae bacterium]|nr:hypothetical protein [Ktedonobacteraceae bacterium]
MQSWSSPATSFAALANNGLAHVFNNHSIVADSGTNAGGFSPLIVGMVLLLILALIGAGIVYVKRKRTASWEEPVNQGSRDQIGPARFPGAYSHVGQGYGNALGAARQEPWPWAKKPVPAAGYNPTTPIPEVLKTPSVPITPMPAMPAILANSSVPSTPAHEMLDVRSGAPLWSPSVEAPGMRPSSGQLVGMSSPAEQAPMTPLPQVPVTPSAPTHNPLQPPSFPVLDAELEAIMQQAQVGLFALPKQHRGQEDLMECNNRVGE